MWISRAKYKKMEEELKEFKEEIARITKENYAIHYKNNVEVRELHSSLEEIERLKAKVEEVSTLYTAEVVKNIALINELRRER